MLQGVDAVVAGDSNVLLEAALLGVFAIYYDFSQTRKDYYGFVEQGLTPYTSSPEDLAALVQNLRRDKPSVRDGTQYYCATVNTAFDGRSAEVAAALIRQILDERIAWEQWQRVPAATNLNAFELKTTGHARHAA